MLIQFGQYFKNMVNKINLQSFIKKDKYLFVNNKTY